MFLPTVSHVVQKDATTGNGEALDLKGACSNLTMYVTGSAGVSAGSVQLETAPDKDYAGTWSAVGAAVTPAATTTKAAQNVGTFAAVRARIATNIVGGTVSVKITAG